MRSIVLSTDGRLAVDDAKPVPVPGASEAVIEVGLCVLPTADVLAFREGRSSDGLSFGNEFLGTVVSVGAAVTSMRPGDRVATILTDTSPAARGGLAEHALVDQSALAKVGLEVLDSVAAQISTAAMAWQAVGNSRVGPGAIVCVVGAGALGLVVLELVSGMRPSAVYVVEPLALRRERALAAGATRVFSRDDDVAAFFLNETEAGGADVVFDCAGQRSTLQFSSVLARGGGGQVVMAAWYDGPDGIDPNAVIKETDIQPTLPRRETVDELLAGLPGALASTLAGSVSRTVKLEDVDAIAQSLWTPPSSDLRVLVSPHLR
jgi:threonine dehydrogenase-like Zn-dependent dehydrogenase